MRANKNIERDKPGRYGGHRPMMSKWKGTITRTALIAEVELWKEREKVQTGTTLDERTAQVQSDKLQKCYIKYHLRNKCFNRLVRLGREG